MEQNIIISNLNDFIFCPRSIYFHNLYSSFDESMYHSTYQVNGRNAHKNIDEQKYSSKKDILESIDIYSEEFGLIGKIDLFDAKNKTLIERKNKITKIYDGYILQVHAQYFCLKEMGYDVKKIVLQSLSDNKRYDISIPTTEDKLKLKKIIKEINDFSLDKEFSQNIKKCKMCIYKELCDYYKNDE
jgi:CRISPR-associated exonuclease Cas4